jgi:hypothetical protein
MDPNELRHGDRVKLWPAPGRRAQIDERPIDKWGGGRFMPAAGATVEWSPFHHSQVLGGAAMLHPPPCTGDKHDHGARGDEDCGMCGRSPGEAQKHDVERAKGIAAAKAAASSLPKHPMELGLHPHSEDMKNQREKESKPVAAKTADLGDPFKQ